MITCHLSEQGVHQTDQADVEIIAGHRNIIVSDLECKIMLMNYIKILITLIIIHVSTRLTVY